MQTTERPVSIRTALTVLDLYAAVYAARHGITPPTGHKALRLGLGPVLMVPDTFTVPDRDDDKIYVCDTVGNGKPAIVFQGDEETGFCRCCGIDGCWTREVTRALDERGVRDIYLEPASYSAVSIHRRT